MVVKGKPLYLVVVLLAVLAACAGSIESDEFLWLEQLRSDRAMAWVSDRNGETESVLKADPRYAAEVAFFERANAPGEPEVVIKGAALHRLVRTTDNPLGIWEAAALNQASNSGAWRTVLDLDRLAEQSGTDWSLRSRGTRCLAESEPRCLVALHPDGQAKSVVREIDLDQGEFVPSGFALDTPAFNSFDWLTPHEVAIASDSAQGPTSSAGIPTSVRIWRRGESLSAARTVFTGGPDVVSASPLVFSSRDGTELFVRASLKSGATEFWHVRPDGAHLLALPARIDAVAGVLDGRLIVRTVAPASRSDGGAVAAGTLLAVPLKDPSGSFEVIFEPGPAQASKRSRGIGISRDAVWYSILDDVNGRLFSARRADRSWRVSEHPVPPYSSVNIQTSDGSSPYLIVTMESFLDPPSAWLIASSGEKRPLQNPEAPGEFAHLVTEQRFATASDGARIPYYVVRPEELRFYGSAPALISTYGGFGVPVTPAYLGDAIARRVLDHGGVFVLANPRGGGEYGPRWHEAGRGANRQTVYDDVAAVAADIVGERIASPERLAFAGSSNAGLVGTVLAMQRPELFAGVVAEVPLTDMLRYSRLSMGSRWTGEYGDPDESRDRRRLRDQSPFHLVRRDGEYPELLLITSTSDDGVHPSHARRLAEKLRSLEKPVLFYESRQGGHAAAQSLRNEAELQAIEVIYLYHKLGILESRGGHRPEASGRIAALAQRFVELRLSSDPTIAYDTGLEVADHGKLEDVSPAAIAAVQATEDALWSQLESMDPSSLDGTDILLFAVLREMLAASRELRVCKAEHWNVTHMGGWHLRLAEVAQAQPTGTPALREQALARWESLPEYVDAVISNLREGTRRGYSVPRPVVRRVIRQLEGLLSLSVDESPYYSPALRDTDAAFRSRFRDVVTERLNPGLDRYREFLETEYLPAARDSLALAALPNGRACYQALLRKFTTLDRTAREVHALGEKSVSQNTEEVLALGRTLYGLHDFDAIVQATKEAADNRFASGEALLAWSQEVLKRAKDLSRPLFHSLPAQDVIIEPAPDYQAGSGVPARYDIEPDITRPGKYVIPLDLWSSETKGNAEVTAVHETFPGHHLQIATARELRPPHDLFRLAGSTAYTEGWARYAERLAEEAGIYSTSYAKVTRRVWPARGMVVDPGIHVFGWRRARAVNYITATGRFDDAMANDLVDRIAGLPGQLTAYDSGGLEILRLREEAKRALGDGFDIRDFHQTVLESGPVPLQSLRDRVHAWLEQELVESDVRQ